MSLLRCPRHSTTSTTITTTRCARRRSSGGAHPISFWLVELLLLSCVAGGAGDSWTKEICHYQPPQVVAQHRRWKVRHIHSIEVDTESCVGKLQWARCAMAWATERAQYGHAPLPCEAKRLFHDMGLKCVRCTLLDLCLCKAG